MYPFLVSEISDRRLYQVPETTTQLPAGTNRLRQAMVDAGIEPKSAYTLSGEVQTMVEDKIERAMAGLKTAVNDRLDLHESKFENFTTAVNDRLALNESRLKDFTTKVSDRFALHQSQFKAFTSSVNDRLNLHEEKIGVLDGKVGALDGKIEDFNTSVHRWFESQATSFGLMAEAHDRLERRMDSQMDRLITSHMRMTWAIIGSAAFAGLCFAVGWLWKMLGG